MNHWSLIVDVNDKPRAREVASSLGVHVEFRGELYVSDGGSDKIEKTFTSVFCATEEEAEMVARVFHGRPLVW